ncbi:MAG: CRISPR-associated protein Cas4 [Candidatus Asgardarchaeia archaeon]
MYGFEIKGMHGTLINADDIADATFCLYTVLLKNIDRIAEPIPEKQKIRYEVYHKLHYILHKFGVEAAEKVLKEIEMNSDPDIRAIYKTAQKMIKTHKRITPLKQIFEKVVIKAPPLGIYGTIPLVRNGTPIVEYFTSEAPLSPKFEDKIKLTAYALLLEYQNKEPVEYGEIEYPLIGRTFSVPIDDRLRRMTIRKRNDIENIIRSGEITHKVIITESKCKTCIYYRVCRYRIRARHKSGI